MDFIAKINGILMGATGTKGVVNNNDGLNFTHSNSIPVMDLTVAYDMYNMLYMTNFHKNIQLAGTVTVGPKGQVVIPANVREGMSIKSGDKLVALYFDDKKSVAFITEAQAQSYVQKMGENFTQFKKELEKQQDGAPEGWD